jgi:hypothetical protein
LGLRKNAVIPSITPAENNFHCLKKLAGEFKRGGPGTSVSCEMIAQPQFSDSQSPPRALDFDVECGKAGIAFRQCDVLPLGSIPIHLCCYFGGFPESLRKLTISHRTALASAGFSVESAMQQRCNLDTVALTRTILL